MVDFKNYNQARLEIESRFTGLPHAHTTLIKSLITRADPETGIVENLSCRDLALLLTVEHAPGRKGAGMPKIATIRSYLRTISENCANEFRLISQGQKLKCQFINLPKIYAHFFASEKVYGDTEVVQSVQLPLENINKSSELEGNFCKENDTEHTVFTAKNPPVKNINNITNNNNNNPQKSVIADNFLPSAETIARAQALGHHNASDFTEIQGFIDHNKAIGSQWADFNPIYLRWLARGMERKQQKAQKNYLGRNDYAGSRQHQPSSNARDRVKHAYANEFDFDEETGRFYPRRNIANGNDGHFVASAY